MTPGIKTIGRRIGHIRIVSLLGSGGMGEVYAGYDERLGRRVALKAIRADHRLKPAAKARFLREARILSQLDHPHICRIHDYIEGEDADFLVLELIEGQNLAQSIREGIDRQRAFSIAIELAEVLAAAHAKGVVHRDLKPQNVMITPAGEAKVLDFGLARPLPASTSAMDGIEALSSVGSADRELPDLAAEGPYLDDTEPMPLSPLAADTSASDWPMVSGPASGSLDGLHTALGSVIGSPRYMSPEQARGEAVTAASDLFALGLLLQEIFTGHPAYPHGPARQQLVELARRGESAPPEGIDGDLVKLIERLKSRAPSDRPPALDVARQLEWIRTKPKRRLRRIMIAAATVILIAVAVNYTLDLRTARDEALHRRAQAEDLIGFMLGDLSQKLKPVGRLDVLADVDDKALEYFASLPPNDMSDSELFKRSQALSEIGQVRMAEGHYAKATQAHRDALGLLERLVPRHPKNVAWRSALGTAHFWVGYDLLNEGHLGSALKEMTAYRSNSEALTKDFPKDPRWRMEAAEGHVNVGLVLKAQRRTTEAIRELESAARTMQTLVAAEPKNQEWINDLRATRSWLGDTLVQDGDLREALAEHQKHQELARRLVALDPDNAQWSHYLEESFNKVGWTLELFGRLDDAVTQLEQGLHLAHGLTARDPNNAAWQFELAGTETGLAEALSQSGRGVPALKFLGKAETTMLRLVELSPKSTSNRELLALIDLTKGEIFLSRKEPRQALQAATRAGSVLSRLSEKNEATAGVLRRQIIDDLLAGRALAALHHQREARRDWESGLARIDKLPREPRDPRVRSLKALLLLELGRMDEAIPIITALHRLGYREPGFERQCRRFKIAA